jgi:signal transduction histidine kinase/CheY-like chemotaxis protein/HAMP domain-containing protein
MMRLRDLSIKAQLTVGLVLLLAFVALLGWIAMDQASKLWHSSYTLYNHPLTVRRALDAVRADVLLIHRDMKNMMLIQNGVEKESTLRSIRQAESDAQLQFAILYDRYLGDRADIDSAFTAFETWKPIRQETLRLLREGRKDEAIRRTFPEGEGGRHAEHIFATLNVLSNFSMHNANSLFEAANELKDELLHRLSILVVLMLCFGSGIGFILLRGLRKPLNELGAATDAFMKGDYSVRSTYASANEFGDLSASFNELAATIQTDIHIKDAANRIRNAVISETTLRPFCIQLLSSVLTETSALFGAIYLRNERNDTFDLRASIGLTDSLPLSYSAESLEGMLGLPMQTREIVQISEIPDDTVFLHPTIAGMLRPSSLVVLPIISGDGVVAMIALGGITKFSDASMRIMQDIRLLIGARLSSVLATEKIREYAEALNMQNRELEAQASELSLQANELSEQNAELAMQQKELNEANRLKTTFLSNMSHELRTPLNSVIALSGVLNRRLKDIISNQELEYIAIIERNGRHLLMLINDILDLSRMEAGREELMLGSVRSPVLLREVVDMLRPQADEKDLALELQLSDDLIDIVTDEAKCRQILINLIGNAIKFTERGTVRVQAAVANECISIAVSDTGIGIPPEAIGHIFDEFRQVDATASRKHEGTGLGLAIVRRYADLLNGSIEVQSTPGVGSVFTFSLPLRPITTSSQESPSHTHAKGKDVPVHTHMTATSGECILVVEDSEAARDQLREILEAEGYQVLFAENGAVAIGHIRSVLPAAVILDLMMPEVDGFEVLRVIRNEEHSKSVPVLILTAKHLTREDLAFLKGNNVHQLIQKGDVNKRDLLASVAAMVRKSRDSHASQKKPRPGNTTGRHLVLVVEDNPDNLTTITALLEDTCDIIQATNGPSCIDAARARTPDLILLDISLPGMDGFRVLELLKADEALRSIPVVALTARATNGEMQDILSSGFEAYLSKPIDPTCLFDIIRGSIHGTKNEDPGN